MGFLTFIVPDAHHAILLQAAIHRYAGEELANLCQRMTLAHKNGRTQDAEDLLEVYITKNQRFNALLDEANRLAATFEGDETPASEEVP
jgi:hypothetical protein